MKELAHRKLILITGMLFLIILGAVFIYVKNFGSSLEHRISETSVPQVQNVELSEKKNIKKITVQRGDESRCIEISPDGAVRVYAVCGEELTSAYREENVQAIMQLYNKLSRTDFSGYKMFKTIPPQKASSVYSITLETDEGTETIYLYFDDNAATVANDVVKIIDTIIQDEPLPTYPPTASYSPTPSEPGFVPTGSPTPVITVPGGSTWTPTPTTGEQAEDPLKDPFTCVFTDETGNKPYRISNIVCSTEPVPND